MRNCRFCHTPLDAAHGADLVLDLDATPLANDLKSTREEAISAERYPLDLLKCGTCDGFQLSCAVDKELLFRDYNYATPDMPSLQKHYAGVHRFIHRRRAKFDKILEIGGNNGAFLRTFNKFPSVIVNVDPAQNIRCDFGDCDVGLHVPAFFDCAIARKLVEDFDTFNLVVARHCFAHIDDLDEICEGVSEILEPQYGIFYIENAYAFATMFGLQFDQIYHEHMSYISVGPVQRLLERHDLRVFDVGFSDVHGGSIMIAACKNEALFTDDLIPMWLLAEHQHLFHRVDETFAKRSEQRINGLAEVLSKFYVEGKTVDIYGATAKSTTLLNVVKDRARHFSVRRCYDRAPLKIGKFLPGTGIPIVPEEQMKTNPPDFCLITAWNYADEIMEREKWYTETFGGHWVLPFPQIRVVG